MTAYGYIRQSRRADLDVALSYDSQLAAILRLAARDGIDPESVVILKDMGRSGAAGKERSRTAYQQLLEAIEGNGHGTTVYALSMSRLARSLDELRRVYAIAAKRGVRIVFEKEGEIRFGEPIGKLHATLVGAVYEFERELAVDRAKENVAERKRRGETMGRRPYGEREHEDPATVVDAFRQAGSYNGAAVLLNKANVPSHLGRKWQPLSVKLVIQREAPELIPLHPRRGAKAVGGAFTFFGLLRCHCGATLTAARSRGRMGVRYKCHRADTDPSHPTSRKSVSEAAVYAWVQAEAARLRVPDQSYRVSLDAAESDWQKLRDRRTKVGDAFTMGAYTREVAAQKLADIDAEMERLAAVTRAETLPPAIDWTWSADVLNNVLRSMFAYVQLDADLLPVRAEWTVPEWRAAE